MLSVFLTIIILTPLIGALVVYLIPQKDKQNYQSLNSFFSFCLLILSLLLFLNMDYYPGAPCLQFIENIHLWGPVSYSMGAGNIESLFLLAFSMTSFCSTFVGKNQFSKNDHVFSLLSKCGFIGVYFSQNIVFIFIFLFLALLPICPFCIKTNKSLQTPTATITIFICMVTAYILLPQTGPEPDPNIFVCGNKSGLLPLQQLYLFPFVFISILIFSAVWPFNNWTANLVEKSNIDLLAVSATSQIGLYFIFKILIPLFPAAIKFYSLPIAVLMVLSIIYAIINSFMEKNLIKIFVNYLSSNSSVIIILVTFISTQDAIKGSLLSCFSSPLIMLILFSSAMFLKQRTHGTTELSGLFYKTPSLRNVTFIGAYAALSLPGTLTFVSHFLMLLSASKSNSLFIFILLILLPVINAAYILKSVIPFFQGVLPLTYYNTKDIDSTEMSALLILGVCLVVMGIYPYYIEGPLINTVKSITNFL